MKRINRLLALMLALMLAVAAMAFAEDTDAMVDADETIEIVNPESQDETGETEPEEVEPEEVEPEVGEVEEFELGEFAEEAVEESLPESLPVEEQADGEAGASDLPVANALTYTGEAQALVTGEGWLYSLDGETYSEEIPTAVDAGEYAVYFKAAGADEAQILLVTIAKADVEFTPPVAAVGE